jgi:hypothetical protein
MLLYISKMDSIFVRRGINSYYIVWDIFNEQKMGPDYAEKNNLK